ncbi:Uncharacterised protein [BD1-7 clade bacterium]|uniref:Uncharacterized protein n=1 Tax=BD1-7 clade bacterium TaxID=2029982 RepID=A0A5S9PMC9_9GAMM|nr:Uncharacterised protein [BD1-7 clade bacterium]CAA0105115.1 Uncharacterised protein [BD1-7 clade bacterium]
MQMTRMLTLTTVLAGGVFALSGCVDNNANYSVLQPSNGQTYVSFFGPDDDPENATGTQELPEQIRVGYSSNPGSLQVFLNGQQIGSQFTLTPTFGWVAVEDIKEFLVQGENNLLVEPLAFLGAATSRFTFDSQGPEINFTNVSRSGGNVTIQGVVDDGANIASLVIETYNYDVEGSTEAATGNRKGAKTSRTGTFNPAVAADKSFSVVVPDDAVFSFTAEDQYGYVYTAEYLATDQTVNPVFKLRINETLLDAVKPLANAQGDNQFLISRSALERRGRGAEADAMEADGAADTSVLNLINDNHSGIYTEIGAAEGNANNCHETPIEFTCTDAFFIDDDFGGTVFNRGTEWSAAGPNRGRWQNRWFCGSYNWTPSPDAGRTNKGAVECSYVEIYSLEIEDLTIGSLGLDETQDSVLDLALNLKDSSGDNIGLDVNLGIYNWWCGEMEIKTGPTDNNFLDGDLCDLATTSSCNTKFGVRLPFTQNNFAPGNSSGGTSSQRALVASQVNPSHWCSSQGETSALGLVGLGGIRVKDNNTAMGGKIRAQINNGDLNFGLLDGFSLGLSGDVQFDGIDLGIIPLDGILSGLIGLLEPLFVDITESVVQNSLTDFDLDFLFSSEFGTSFNLGTQAWTVTSQCTQNSNANDPYTCGTRGGAVDEVDWLMTYRGNVNTVEAQTGISQVLGSLYYEDDLLAPINNLESSTDNFAIAIHHNIVNQALASFYEAGLMHFTMLPGSTAGEQGTPLFLGANATDELGSNGNTRVRLIPNSPATVELSGEETTQATIRYTNATVKTETRRDGAWDTDFTLVVDIQAGVLLSLDGQVLETTLLGSPQLEIKDVETPDGLEFIEPLIQPLADLITDGLLPLVTNTALRLDLTEFELPLELSDPTKALQLSTEGIEANNGRHLSFSTGINLIDKE